VRNSSSVISSFSEDDMGRIWVGSENYGLYLFDPKSNSYTKKENSPIERIKSMMADEKQRL